MLKLGDSVYVKSQRERFPEVGRIVALLEVDYFENVMCQQKPSTTAWDEAVSGWRESPLAMVYYVEPQPAMTMDEWVNAGVEQGYEEGQCESDYDEMVPKTQQVVFPLGDLEDADGWDFPEEE
jgi:hypothetical protein